MHPEIIKLNIATKEFSPVVLSSALFEEGRDYPQGYRLEERYVYDYEIEYFLYSDGAMVIEGEEFPIHAGDIVLRRPGQFVQGVMPYTCYLICFDLLGNTGKDPETYNFHREQEFQGYYMNPVLDSIPPVFRSINEEKFRNIFEAVFREYIHSKEGSQLLLKTCMLQLLYQLYMDCRELSTSNTSIPRGSHYGLIKKTIDYINQNIGGKLTLEMLAENAQLSESHLHKVFSRAMNITPNEYVTKLRLDKAKALLVKTRLPISEIASTCGFENIPYFSYVFKKQLQVSPGEFRKRHEYI